MLTNSRTQQLHILIPQPPQYTHLPAAGPLKRYTDIKCMLGSIESRSYICHSNNFISSGSFLLRTQVSRTVRRSHIRLQPCCAFQYDDPSPSLVISWQGITPTMVDTKPLDRKKLLLSVAQQACGWDQAQWEGRYANLLVILPNLDSLLQRLSAAQLLNLMARPDSCAAKLVHLTDTLPAGCSTTRMAASFPGLLFLSSAELAEVLELARVTFSKEERLSDDQFSFLLMQHPNLLDVSALQAAMAESVRWFRRPATKMTLHILDQGVDSVYITVSPVYDAVVCVWLDKDVSPAEVREQPV